MKEKDLKDGLVARIRGEMLWSVVIRHEDKGTAGIPDISVTATKRTTWIEVKHANPGLSGKGIQNILCCRLDDVGHCVYVVYEERRGIRRTLILNPHSLREGKIGELGPRERMITGFSHDFVVSYLKETHDYIKSFRVPGVPRDSGS